MPSLRSRHSWPQLRRSHHSYVDKAIDSDPFAYFVSPDEDRVVYIEGNLTAGIKSKSRSRSLPPFQSRGPRLHLSISTTTRSPTARLKRWIERMEQQYFHLSHKSTDEPDPIIKIVKPKPQSPIPRTEPVVIPISPPIRGRRDARTGSGQRRTPNNGRTPPRRPRVWREPSAEIWSVPEEDEDISFGLGITVSQSPRSDRQQSRR